MVKVQPVLLKQRLQVLHRLSCLLLHIIRDQLHRFGIQADVAWDVHNAIVDPRAGVWPNRLGPEQRVDGLDDFGHAKEDINDLIISYVSF